MATDTDRDTPRFEEVDWDSVGGTDLRVSLRTGAFVVLFGALVALYLYDVYVLAPDTPTLLILGETWTENTVWDASRMDWLSMAVGVVLVSFGVVPALADPSTLRDAWDAYPKDALSLVALGYVVVFVLVGLVGPLLLDQPTLQFDQARQPPVYVEVPMKYLNICLNPTDADTCRGTWATPLGTTTGGEDMVNWLAYGTRTALQFALVSAVLMVPIATLVGTSAAYLGGRYDAVLMRYVDVQDSVPTVIVYFLLVIFFGPTLFMLVVAYGLFNWGDLARLVRGEALSIKEEQYVTAARSAGAGPLTIVRRHLVPNLSSTLVANLGMLIPKLILVEALFSFLKLSGDKSYSWGQLIQRGLFEGSLNQGTIIDMGNLEGLWWIPVLPAVAIALSVMLFFVFGDALQSAVEPRNR